MSLGDLVGNFLTAWEGDTPLWNHAYNTLSDALSKSTFGEFLEQYNVISLNKLWNDDIEVLFYDVAIERYQLAGFRIVIRWNHIQEWLDNPMATLEVDESETDPMIGFFYARITDDDLSDDEATSVKRFCLRAVEDSSGFSDLYAKVRIRFNSETTPFEIIGIYNNRYGESIDFSNIYTESSGEEVEDVLVPILIVEDYETNVYRRIYKSFADKKYITIDPRADQIYNELLQAQLKEEQDIFMQKFLEENNGDVADTFYETELAI